mmetsp:Transcript_19491/g.74795  ORF Transcript_19491/g.74795 Transcript_19491/m.74795 type:complete len:559 (+) Transcript_19491:123-1799(+)
MEGRRAALAALLLAVLWAALVAGVGAEQVGKPFDMSASILEEMEALSSLPMAEEELTVRYGFPRNVSDIYRGEWVIDGDKTSMLEIEWKFEKFKGQYLMHITTRKTLTEGEDLVMGYVELRDGSYSTDEVMKYRVFGSYTWSAGQLLLGAVPLSNTELVDAATKIVKNTTQAERIRFPDELESLGLYKNVPEGDCPLRLSFQVQPLTENELRHLADRSIVDPHHRRPEDPLILLEGTASSEHCKFHLTTDGEPVILAEYYTKALHYVMIVTFMSFLQMGLMAYQIEASNTQAGASKVSMAAIGMQAVIDSYICLFHLSIGIFIEATLNAFITASFFKFVIFSVFEMRYLLLIWKARRPLQADTPWDAMRQQLRVLYTRIYIALIGGFLLLYSLGGMVSLFVFVLYSFWVPQIYCNASRGVRYAVKPKYLIGISLTRMFIPMYFLLCPTNFLHIEPDPFLAQCLCLWVAFQVCVLLLQDKYGPRFFIPKQLLPLKYDYYHRVDFQDEEKECVICMCAVEPREANYMITPCDHIFHSTCLDQWMQQKMQCPTCRRPLPEP